MPRIASEGMRACRAFCFGTVTGCKWGAGFTLVNGWAVLATGDEGDTWGVLRGGCEHVGSERSDGQECEEGREEELHCFYHE